MRLIKAGIVAGVSNTAGYETIVKVLGEPELLEICTPVVFGSQNSAIQTTKTVQTEQSVTFNFIKTANDAADGRINLVDGFESEEDSLSAAITAYMNNCIDVIVIAPSSLNIGEFVAKAIEAENNEVFNWKVNGNVRLLSCDLSATTPEEQSAVIQRINNSLRRDYTLIKPRTAIVSKQEDMRKLAVSLRAIGVFTFGPFDAEKFVSEDLFSHYDACIFDNEAKASSRMFEKLDPEKTIGYVSGLPMVLTYILENNEASVQCMKEAIYSAIDIHRARIAYRRATHSPLEKQWIPRGRDDFKLDLTKEETE